MLHHKNKHVLTLSFSIASGRRLLIQQIQTKNRRRNRWLYTLKKPLIAHAIACFRKAFPKHTLFLVNPEDLTRKSLDSYASSLACAHRIKTRLEKNSLPTDDICAHIRTTMEKRETLLSDRPRIIQKYRDAMPHISKTDTFSYNSMAHTLLPPNIPV